MRGRSSGDICGLGLGFGLDGVEWSGVEVK